KKCLLEISDAVSAKMKYRSSERRVCVTGGKDIDEMLCVSRPTGSNHGNRDRRRYGRRKLAVKAQTGAVTVHGCEKYFARAALFSFARPLERFLARSSTSAGNEDFSGVGSKGATPRINGNNHRLGTKAPGNLA